MSETNLSVPASIDIDFENKKISRLDVLNSILTSKEQLGYKWEFIVQNTLLNLGIHNFEGNPLNPILWKIQGCGYSRYKDNKVDIKTYYFDIECKYVNHRVYPSHVKHNLIPRFTENGKIHVTITNNVKLWSKDARDEARKQNIKIWSLKDLISFYKTPSFISIYNFIRRNVSCTTLLNGYDLKCISDLKCVSKSNVNSKNETEKNGARTEEKTNGSTLNEYIVPPSEGGTEKCSRFDSTSTVSTETVSMEKLKLEARNTQKRNSKNQNTEKQKQKSEIESLEPVSSKSSATFKDKFRTKLRSAFVNLLSEIEMLFPKLFDRRTSKGVLYGCSQRVSV